jgi:hypothetical protein
MQNRLDNKQQAIIPIAAFAAKGDTENSLLKYSTGWIQALPSMKSKKS